MSAITNQLLQETIEEGLNEVFYDSYGMETPPNIATLEDIFKNETSKKHAEYDLEMRGVGRFSSKSEEQDINEDRIAEKYKTTYTHTTFANSVPVSKEQMEDQLYNLIRDDIGELGDAARDTQYSNAFAIFRNAFSSSYLGADGKALCADDHPRDFGGTLDNKETAKLSPSVLQTMLSKLVEQKSHSGRNITNVPYCLLVAPANFKRAVEITDAEEIAQSANNGPNVFSAKYNIFVKQSPYIGASESGGSDDYFFLIGKRHKVKRFVRTPIQTWMNGWNESRKTVAYYNARFRESYGWSSPIGIIGSDGTTGSYAD
jgi:hypothetical protein